MRLSSLLRIGTIICVFSLTSGVSFAQVTNYDPEYDEEAAGTLENATAGDSETPSPGAPAPEPEPSAETPMDDGASAEADGSGSLYYDESAVLDGEGAAALEEQTTSDDELLPWQWGGERHLPALGGYTGLYHMMDADSDEMGTFGLGFHGAFFAYEDYLYRGDRNVSMWSGLTLRVTPWDYLEVWLGLDSRANHNTMGDPDLFQSLGDFHFGLKGFYPVLDALSLGATFGFEFKNPVGEIKASMDGTTFPLGALISFNAAELNKKVPIKAHLNFIYRFDNSAKLVADIEADRGGCGTDLDNDGIPDYDGCLTPVERTSLEIDRLDQFRIGIGVEGSLPYVTPLLEWNIDIPVNRQDFVCPRPTVSGSAESCMDQAGIKGMRQWLTIGFRILPPLKTMTVDLGVDVGVTGYAPSVHELSAQAPYRVILGLTYSFDPFAKPVVKEVAAPCPDVPVTAPAPPESIIVGNVRDADTGAPLFGANIVYRNKGYSAQMTGADGKFASYPFEPGEITVDIKMEGYEDNSFKVVIPDPSDPASAEQQGGTLEIALDCPMVKRQVLGQLNIRVTSDTGAPLSGVMVQLENDAQLAKGMTDDSGELSYQGAAGDYIVTVTREGYFDKTRRVTVSEDSPSTLSIQMSTQPDKPAVELSKERIKIKKRIMFSTGSGDVAPESYALLDEVVQTLRQHPEIRLVEIQGHTDDRGKAKVNTELSQDRADAVRRYLVNEGVDSSRLSAKGFGSSRPRAPNITASGRARNRRVEFHIIENGE